jgi:hypothetical protein
MYGCSFWFFFSLEIKTSKATCVDLTGISPLVGLGVGGTDNPASSKMVKHEKTCSDNQHVLIPFAFDTFNFLASEA